ncbi:MAG: TIR domain-containing protein [Fibrobacter sp.]|nr:TIR domain-containing protein [Fibrobacter sp.]
MHKVFISYHHDNDQWYKDYLVNLGERKELFIDWSVDSGDISDELSDEQIRVKIRDEYLRESSITILLVGTETKNRKHIDWELFSSMYDGSVNRQSGILVILLPSVKSNYVVAAHETEKRSVFPNISGWCTINEREEYERRYPYLPARIIDNLLAPNAKISVVNWDDLDADKLKFMLDCAYNDRQSCVYDLSRPMRRQNS